MNAKTISFTKTITRTYNVLWAKANFTTFTDDYKNIRRQIGDGEEDWRCFKCDVMFLNNDIIGLACFVEVGNKILCQKCAEELVRLFKNENK